jgi:hypothetical protein
MPNHRNLVATPDNVENTPRVVSAMPRCNRSIRLANRMVSRLVRQATPALIRHTKTETNRWDRGRLPPVRWNENVSD